MSLVDPIGVLWCHGKDTTQATHVAVAPHRTGRRHPDHGGRRSSLPPAPVTGPRHLTVTDSPEGMSPAMPATYSNTPPTPDRLISVAAAASMAKCSPATIRRRIDSGDLRSWSMGPRLTRVDSAEVMARLCGDDH